MDNKFNFETNAVLGASLGDKITGAISFPIYQTSTFRHEGLNKSTGYDYSRLQNPTREEAEKTIAILEEGKEAISFATGLAAITACIHLLKSGEHIILSEDLYGGTFRLFNEIYKDLGIKASFVDTTKIEDIKASITENTKAIFIETPSNPSMRVSDIEAVAKLSKENNLITIVDNTFLTSYYQKPLLLGADIVVYSATKYLSGHNDLLAGFIVSNNDELLKKLRTIQKSTGATLGPFDSWLLLRGLKTLHIRLDRAEENALKVVEYLSKNKNIEEVYYIGKNNNLGYKINKKQSKGYGAMISFRVKDKNIVPTILEGLKVIRFAESLGGVESLITYPVTQTHGDMPIELKEKLGIDERLLRLSVGIESSEDIINDLKGVLGE